MRVRMMSQLPKTNRISKSEPGWRLQRARQALRLTRKDIAERLSVSVRTVGKIDTGRLAELDMDDRTKARVLRDYALLVNLHPAQFANLVKPTARPATVKLRGLIIINRRAAGLMVGLVSLLAAGFLVSRTYNANTAPMLVVVKPDDGLRVNDPRVVIEGKTSSQAQVYVNDVAVPVDPSGIFTTEAIVRKGVNVIAITSVNALGKQARVVRSVVYSVD